MDPKGFEKKPWFPYLKNMYDEIEEDMMTVDAKGYEEKPWWPYVLDLQEKIDAGGGNDTIIARVTDGVLDKTWQEIYDVFSVHGIGSACIYWMSDGVAYGAFLIGAMDNTRYSISVYDNNALSLCFFADSPSDYPYED